MSSDAIGWVFRHSPASGARFLVHLAAGDSANDQNAYELWMRQSWLADKARVSRKSAGEALAWLCSEGFIVLLESGKKRGSANRYRFLFPDVATVFDGRSGTTSGDTGVPRGVTPGTTSGDTGVPRGVTQNPSSNSTSNARVSSSASPTAKAQRIPDPFMVTPAMKAWAAENIPVVDLAFQTAQFCDYWRAESGQRARKVDWVAAWRTWLRRAESTGNRTIGTPVRESVGDFNLRTMRERQAKRAAQNGNGQGAIDARSELVPWTSS